MEEMVSDAGIPASRSQVMPPCHCLSSIPVLVPCLVHRQRRWQLCPLTSKILEQGWQEGRQLAQPAATLPAAWRVPVPSQSASQGEMSCWRCLVPAQKSQQDTVHPSWPQEAPAGPRHWERELLPAHRDQVWWDGVSRGGRQWRSAGGLTWR